MGNECDYCVYNVYDDEEDTYYCDVYLDEDDAAKLAQRQYSSCPYFKSGDEYAVVKKQM
ncbi:MAG: DUF6472 family protein [Lachnospiraceae bacterium]|nr:DUF6472 family protein [Lachnospiraceae bacterium]